MVNVVETPEMAISWDPYVWPQALPLTLNKLRAAEQRLGVRFPQDYVDCVLQHQGQTPEPCTFSYGDGYSRVNAWCDADLHPGPIDWRRYLLHKPGRRRYEGW